MHYFFFDKTRTQNRACSQEVPSNRRRMPMVLALPAQSNEARKLELGRALARAHAAHHDIPSLHPAPEELRRFSSVPKTRVARRHGTK